MIKRVRGIPRRFRFPWRTPSQVEREVDDELEFHLAMRAEELERGGSSAEDARREALRGFGDFEATCRDLALSGQRGERQARWRTTIEDCWRDVRYGARSLARSPGFTAVAIIVLAVGIAAERFTGHNPIAPELWLPLGLVERFGGGGFAGVSPRLDDRENRRLLATLFGRIGTGSSRADVETDLDILAARLHAQHPPADGVRPSYVAAPLPRFSIGNAPDADDESLFVAVLGAVLTGLSGVVLLIACINLANMFLARGAGRRTEIAIRQALGGSRLRLVRQFLVEGMLLALAGGAAGLLAAYWAVRGLLSSVPTTVGIGVLQPEMLDVRPGAFVLAATLVSCLVATLLFGLGPAWKISGEVAATLKESAGGHVASVAGRARALLAPRNLLIVTQVALSLALLTAGGLFVRGSVEAGRATPGFALEPITLAELDPSLNGYDEPRSREIFRQALERARALPGVESASFASLVPFDSTSHRRAVQPAGAGDGGAIAHYYVVADAYFETLGLPLLAGRTFTAAEASSAGGNPVAIIDEPLAQQLFGGTGQALGRFIELPSRAPGTQAAAAEIVGVAPGTRHRMTDPAPSPHVYVPFGQVPFAQRFGTTMHLHVRVADTVEAAALLEPLRNALMAVDSALPVLSLKTMVEHRDGGLVMWGVRAGGRIFSMLGALALFLAFVGAYGVKAFLVTRRTREIGVRMALGATPGDVMRQMLRESLGLTVAGLATGLLLAVAVARLLSALLYGVSPIDPLVLTTAATVLAAALLLAAYLPTRRATRIDPTTALRHE